MRYKFSAVLAFLAILLVSFVTPARAADFGFIQENIWFSKDPFFVGDSVRIYTGVFNGRSDDIAGAVEFFDNNVSIGKTDFSVTGGGRLREIWVDYKATAGNHIISAKIIKAAISKAGEPDQPITVSNSESGKSERLVDSDTDRDGLGDNVDNDDDNDGLIDSNDLEPLTPGAPNTPPATSAQSTAPGFTAQTMETVTAKVDTVATGWAGRLRAKEAELRAEIAEFKAKEEATEQSEVGEQVNQATGDENFVPATRPTGKPSDTIRRIGKQLYLFLILAAIYILEHPTARYIALGILALFLLRWLWRALRH